MQSHENDCKNSRTSLDTAVAACMLCCSSHAREEDDARGFPGQFHHFVDVALYRMNLEIAVLFGNNHGHAVLRPHEGSVCLSPVLEAMGVPAQLGRGAVRLSVGRFTTEEEIDRAAQALGRSGRYSP